MQKATRAAAIEALKFDQAAYIRFDPCEGDDGCVTCRTVKLVRARKAHPCFLGTALGEDGHSIQPGDIYRSERALVDGDYWGSYAVCVPCMDKWLTDIGRPQRTAELPAERDQ